MDERNMVPSSLKNLWFYGSVFRLRKASLPHNGFNYVLPYGFNHIVPYGFNHILPNRDDLPGWQPNLAPENAWWRQVQMQYQAFWEAFRKFHHQLCRFQLMSLTCQVPWPPVAARGVSLLRGAGLLYRLSRINFRERPRKKDYEGLTWLGGGSQVQREIPCDSGQMHEETAKWQGLVDTLSLILDEASPLLPIFQVNYVVPLQSWKAKLQPLSRLVPFMRLMGSE